jgi:hypothetical protein
MPPQKKVVRIKVKEEVMYQSCPKVDITKNLLMNYNPHLKSRKPPKKLLRVSKYQVNQQGI